MTKIIKFFCVAMIVFMANAFLFNFLFFVANAETITQNTLAIVIPTSQLLAKSLFKENEQASTMIHSRFNDGSTNIIFYIDYGNNNFQYNAETTGHGDLPLSDYYAPAPGIGKYIVVEYFNDGGIFDCNGISLSDCITDPHFVSQESFEIVDDNAIIPVPTPPTIDIIDSGAIPDNNFVPVASSSDSAPVDSTSTPETTPAPVIQENGDGSTTLIAI